jgi:hypothetical protein
MVRVDDVVTDPEGALRGLDLEVGYSRLDYDLLCCLGNWSLLSSKRPASAGRSAL